MRYEHDSLYSLQRLVPTDPAVDFRAFYPYTPNEVKHRRRTTGSQLKVLETVFRVDTKPNATLRNDLAAQLGMTPRGVQVWFQNRRAKEKNRVTRKSSSSSAVATGSTTSSSTDSTTPNAESSLNDEDETDTASPPPPTPGEELSEDLFKQDLPSDIPPDSQVNSPSFPFPSPPKLHLSTDSTHRSSSAGSWKPLPFVEHSDNHSFPSRPSLADIHSQRRGSLPANAFFHPYSTAPTSTHGPRSIDAWDPLARRRSVDTSLQRLVMHPYAQLARARNGALFGPRSPSQAQSPHQHSLPRGKTWPLQPRNTIMPHQPPPTSYLDTRRASMDPRTLMPHRLDGLSPLSRPLHPVRASLPDTSLFSTSRRYVPQIPGPLPAPNFTFGAATVSSPGSTEYDLPSPDFSSYSFPSRDNGAEDDDAVSVSCLSFETLSRFGSAVSIATSDSSVFSNPGFYGIGSPPGELAPNQRRSSCTSQLADVPPGFKAAIPPHQCPTPVYFEENPTGATGPQVQAIDVASTSSSRPPTSAAHPPADAPVPSASRLISTFDVITGTPGLSSSSSLSPNNMESEQQNRLSPGHGPSHPQPSSADQAHLTSGHQKRTLEDDTPPVFGDPFRHKIGIVAATLENDLTLTPAVPPDQQISLTQPVVKQSVKGNTSHNEPPFTTTGNLASSQGDYATQYANLMGSYGFAVPHSMLDDGSLAHVIGKVEGKSDAVARCGPIAHLGANIVDGFPPNHIVSPTPYNPGLNISSMTTNQPAL